MDGELQLIEDGVAAPRAESRLAILYRDNEAKVIGLISVVIFLSIWQWAGTSGIMNPMFLSAPSRVLAAGVQMFATGEMWTHISASGQEFAVGYGLSVVAGIPLGVLTGWYRRVNHALDPLMSALYATPRISFLPLLIIWFGIGMNSKVALIFLEAVFPLIINTFTGVRTIDASLVKAARSFGARDRQIFFTIALPSSVPFIITGLRLAVGRALIGVVVSELYSARAGVGYLIALYGNTFQTDKVFVGVFIIAVWGVVLMELLKRIEARFDAWRPQRG